MSFSVRYVLNFCVAFTSALQGLIDYIGVAMCHHIVVSLRWTVMDFIVETGEAVNQGT